MPHEDTIATASHPSAPNRASPSAASVFGFLMSNVVYSHRSILLLYAGTCCRGRAERPLLDADLLQLALEFGTVQLADDVGCHGAVGADEKRLRKGIDAVAARDGVVAVEPVRPIGVLVGRELFGVLAEVAGADAEHRELPVLRREGLPEERELLAARVAPRCPEVQDNWLPSVVGEANSAAVEACQCEVGRRLTDARRVRLRAGRETLTGRTAVVI